MNNKNALLIIDMQQEDGFVLEHFDSVVANTAFLLETARQQRVPILYTCRPANPARPTAAPAVIAPAPARWRSSRAWPRSPLKR
ncbi:hypothetical protein D3C84_712790 [compost metagenome]